jgi:primosomal protein N' (replication factor Y)
VSLVVDTETRVRVADVVVDPRAGGLEATWTYAVPPDVEVGDALFVPLSSRAVVGFASRVYGATEDDLGFSFKQLRKVFDRIEGLTLPLPVLDLAKYVAEEYLCPYSLALSAAAPSGIRDRLVTGWRLIPNAPEVPTTPLQREIIATLQEIGVLVQRAGKNLPASTVRALKLLRAKNVVEQRLHLQPSESKKERTDLLMLAPDGEKIERFLKKDGKRKPAQALTLMRLQTGEPSPLTPSEIKTLSGITDATLKAMVEGGLLVKVEQSALMPKPPPRPNPMQERAIASIVSSITEARHEGFLLFGVTGSGKTEVYLNAASEALRQGRQVLYLVPEIALATQAMTQLRDRFGNRVALLHSDLPPKERLDNWSRIKNGESPVVLGARSALFAPLTNLGLIVVDEEHETSYKQESAPRYHANELALFLGRRHNAAVVLGSATPSVETYQLATEGRLTLLELPIRAAEASLPTVHLVDLTEGYKAGSPSILSEDLHERLDSTVKRGEQAILFLNRRAYSPFLICRDCGHQFKCPRCAVSLAFSRSDRRLRCHHCGYWTSPPDFCPECQGHRLNPFGVGTEKVEEAVRIEFPAFTVARLDRDVARKKGALEEVLARFRSGDIDVLVGTQMVAKGLDFPNVTLVGVVAADISLNIPDFRSSERTFQLLAQVAGRAGRGRLAGHVVVQTFNPTHPAVTCAQNHDYLGFFSAMQAERAEAIYPPFSKLVNLVLSGENQGEVEAAGTEVGNLLQDLADAVVLGPTQCAIERIQGRWRWHLLIKLPPGSSVAGLGELLKKFESKSVQLTVDVDPYSLT